MNEGEAIIRALIIERPNLAEEGLRAEEAGRNLYRLAGRRSRLFVKRFSKGDPYGEAEISISRRLGDVKELRIPRLECVIDSGETFLAAWEWLEGHDLRLEGRERLPEAFAQVGSFHAGHRNPLPVLSPTTRLAYSTIPELLRAEFDFLLSFLPPGCQIDTAPAIGLLSAGYPTLIHGDLHAGNILLTPQGLVFTDWGYAMNSLCLFDLSYVEYEAIPGEEVQGWWTIGPEEAKRVLEGYYTSSGFEGIDIPATHRAVRLWGELQGYFNCVKYHNRQAAKEAIKKIEWLAEGISCES
jgi:hypothetical protein